MQHMTNQRLKLRTWSVLGLAALLVACEAPPPRRTVVATEPVAPRIMVYPAQGQSPEQLERDRYECHVWAVQQTGFDPSRPGLPPGERVVVEPANPPGSGPRDAGFGAVFGGVTGAAIGASSDVNAQAQANAEQARLDQGYARTQAGADNYRRAISACLDARGYKTA